jgi:hypothetical protein
MYQFINYNMSLQRCLHMRRYDFSVYSQLSATLTALFFDWGDSSARALGYW